MSKIITTLHKNVDEPWILLTKDTLQPFSPQELHDVVDPYTEYVKKLPGVQFDKFTTVINDTSAILTMVFDTPENMYIAKDKLFGTNLDKVVVNKNELIRSKVFAENVFYSKDIAFVE
jgi:hypothetical protein